MRNVVSHIKGKILIERVREQRVKRIYRHRRDEIRVDVEEISSGGYS
jgi:hypothetical protein